MGGYSRNLGNSSVVNHTYKSCLNSCSDGYCGIVLWTRMRSTGTIVVHYDHLCCFSVWLVASFKTMKNAVCHRINATELS